MSFEAVAKNSVGAEVTPGGRLFRRRAASSHRKRKIANRGQPYPMTTTGDGGG